MKQKTLAIMLMAVIIGVAVCAAVVYVFVIPELGRSLAEMGGGEIRNMYSPWIWFVSFTSVPVAAALAIAFLIALNIRRDRSFCMQNARFLAVIGILAAADTLYFFIGNIVLLFLNMNHPGLFLFDMLVCFFGLAVTLICAALSHYTRKAAELRADADLTI